MNNLPLIIEEKNKDEFVMTKMVSQNDEIQI